MKNSMKVAAALAGAAVVVVGGTAFTDANTLDEVQAGTGEGVVSGVQVTHYDFTLTDDDITGVEFTLKDPLNVNQKYLASATVSDGSTPTSSTLCTVTTATAKVACTFAEGTTLTEITETSLNVWPDGKAE